MTTSHASASGSGRPHARLWRSFAAGLLSIGLAALIAQTHGHAEGQNPLPYSTGFLVTGNYVVGAVDVEGQSTNGVATGTILMAGVPANADILAAYLYWETIDLPGSLNLNPLTTPVKFRGQPVTDANVKVVKGSSVPGIGASCYSSGTPLTLTMFRADVLHLLKSDPNVKKPERRLVNDADLQANGFGLNTVTLPEAGNGNNTPQSAGASLFVVYRDAAEPLRKIVVYDGVYVQPSLDVPMTQTLRGFYQSASG
ncbi:MAG TPA: hypothetical protein VK504_13855, partial [Vicinamibacterales bacterium]|nr:hypothetical protein [Vicinamibacterales bacterium]